MKNAEKVVMRNEYYKDSYRTLVLVAGSSLILLFFSLIVNVYIFFHKEDPLYFFVDNHGRVVPASPVNQPYVSQDYILNWASKAVSKSWNLNAVDYRDQVQSMRDFFTDEGYQQYQNSLDVSKQLEWIVKNALIASAVPSSVPVIVREGVVNGVYVWQVKMPLRVSYTNVKGTLDKNFGVTMTIVRRPTYENPYGIGINQYILREM